MATIFIILAVCILFGLIGTWILLKVMKKNTTKLGWAILGYACLLLYPTIIFLNNPTISLFDKVRLYEVFLNITIFSLLVITLIRKKVQKSTIYLIGYLSVALISMITLYFGNKDDFSYYSLFIFEFNIWLIIVLMIIMKNIQAVKLIKGLAIFLILHNLFSILFAGLSIMESLLTFVVYCGGIAIAIIPLYFIAKLRFKNYKPDVKKEEKVDLEAKIEVNILNDIID